MKKTTLYLFALLLLSGCITKYDHPGIKNMVNLLVVEGIITEGDAMFTLSRSVGLTEETTAGVTLKINTAEVTVVCDDGTVFSRNSTAPVTNGEYTIPIDRLDPDKRYQLRIHLEGSTYESELRYPQPASVIDELEFFKPDIGQPIQMKVSATGSEGSSRFYLWSYREIWEVEAPIYAFIWRDENGDYRKEHPTPFHYCWAHDSSKGFLFGSSAKLSTNTIRDHVLAEFEPKQFRFRTLYWISLKQNTIGADTFEYFSNLQRTTESSGGIFSPIISEMKGNITCKDNPDIPVIGFIEVSQTTVLEKFVTPSSGLYEDYRAGCEIYDSDEDLARAGLSPNEVVFIVDTDMSKMRALPRCVDCREHGGTKTKPDFWPNDHK